MANPQPDRFVRVAHDIAKALCKRNFSAYELRVLWVILYKTYGFDKKTDRIPFSQFVAYTGLDRRHIDRALRTLLAKNVIFVTEGYYYGVQKDYDAWVPFPESVMVSLPIQETKSLPIEETLPIQETALPIEETAHVQPLPIEETLPIQAESLPIQETSLSLSKEDTRRDIHKIKDLEILSEIVRQLGLVIVEEALQRAAVRQRLNWGYVKTIAHNLRAEGWKPPTEENGNDFDESKLSLESLIAGTGELLSVEDAWEAVKEELKTVISKANQETWLKHVRPLGFNENVFFVTATDYVAQNVNGKLVRHIERILSSMLDRPMKVHCRSDE